MITRMDREIGKMMALISELGLDDDTIFVFISDNGSLNGTHQGLGGVDAAFFNSSSGFRDGKGTLYEGGIRSPGILRWKGKVQPGSTSQAITGFEDLMPTLLDLCGVKDQTPAGIDGTSFASVLRGESQKGREFLYREFTGYGGQQCVRLGKWKYLRTGLSGGKAKKAAKTSEELYDLENDPAETTNLLAKHPEVVTQMKAIAAREHQNSADFKFPALDQ